MICRTNPSCFREPTVWERYWAYITAAVTAIALQAMLIRALLVNRRRRRRAERIGGSAAVEAVLSDILVALRRRPHPDAVEAPPEIERVRCRRGAIES